MLRPRFLLVTSFFVFSLTSANASSICDPDVIAQLKNVQEEHISEKLEDRVFYSYCQKSASGGTSLAIGPDSGQLSQNKTVTEACLIGDRSFFWKATSDFMVSNLPEAVQKQLIFACSPGGLLFEGFDDGTTISVTAKFQRVSDGSTQVTPLKVKSLLVSGAAGVTCKGSLAMEKTPISSDGTSASCDRGKNKSRLKIQLDALEGKKELSAVVEFEGTKLIEIPWLGPSNAGTDGNWFHCSAFDGNFQPGGSVRCRDVAGACDGSPPRIAYCVRAYGNFFEINPAGDLYRLWTMSYKDQVNKEKCNDPSTDADKDLCVLHRIPVSASVTVKTKEYVLPAE